jgi:hypothetical protein
MIYPASIPPGLEPAARAPRPPCRPVAPRSAASPRAVVIGSGFGGLAAALRLRAMGLRGDGAGGAGPAGRAGARVRARRLHLRRGAHGDHRALPAGGAVRALRPRDGRLRASWCRWTRSTGSCSTTAATSTTWATRRACWRRSRRSSPRDVDGYRRLAAHAERIFDVGYTRLADRPFDRLADMVRVVPEMVRLGSHRSVGYAGRPLHPRRAAAQAPHLRAAAGGGEPVHHHLHLPADPLAGAEVGGPLRTGRDHVHRPRAGAAAGGAGGGGAARHRRWPHGGPGGTCGGGARRRTAPSTPRRWW